MTWWQREIATARERADRAEQEQENAVQRRKEAERIDERARKAETALRKELQLNGFTEALRKVLIGGAA
ncbi:hypothetical protein MA5S0422_4052 [Mycobacteroides abscessus 5S-0422]|uniref:Uncharacterized protein n=1 Tax=Mycobacteroides abscessus subsp. bolletii 1513 TaxID=1299321 RepID=X8DKD3_9MYCO|nr:hypothetical protein [Mycobacteroides abscessus]EUA68178.1 hypothetical protein I540_4127 [Mycobacteroides abscessus subsp. bolletii 1513]AMU76499.1 hypothetical protein A3O06_19510 [Mycobacteroides abscessus]ANO00225.1 hypothetical protein BAB74_17005 [Mycobacteroides abscessus]ANO25445.1 hypothetical protein BAB79_19505 [Mycobacteroides abscessus]EIU05466.1 hypothetical protein MA5S0422_4052 [Mycobacteroides abscessus 5S-0422]